MKKRTVITIARQFGSGGHEIGEKLAEKFEIPFYDRALIELAAQKSGLSPEEVSRIDERASGSLLYSISTGLLGVGAPLAYGQLPVNDTLYLIQSEIIQNKAKEGSCVIVGRCADYVLRDDPAAIHLFLYAPLPARVERIMKLYNLNEAKATELIQKTDKRRASYHNYYALTKWGKMENYHFAIDTALLGADGTVNLLSTMIEQIQLQVK